MSADGRTEAEVLREQYGDETRLAARQRLWRDGGALARRVLDLAQLDGTERVLDVGCGNGRYLDELGQRGHAGAVLGLDYSPGMAATAAPYGPTAVADAQALPVRDGAVDVVLCAHMLYHVPDIPRAVAELRRVVRPGGSAVVATNDRGHTVEAKRVMAQAVREVAGVEMDLDWDTHRFDREIAHTLLAEHFEVGVHDLTRTIALSDAGALAGYLASWPPESAGLTPGPMWTAALARADELVREHFAGHTEFDLTSRVHVLIGR